MEGHPEVFWDSLGESERRRKWNVTALKMTFTFSKKQQQGADAHMFLWTRRYKKLAVAVLALFLTASDQRIPHKTPSVRVWQSMQITFCFSLTKSFCVLANKDTLYIDFHDCVWVLQTAEGPYHSTQGCNSCICLVMLCDALRSWKDLWCMKNDTTLAPVLKRFYLLRIHLAEGLSPSFGRFHVS